MTSWCRVPPVILLAGLPGRLYKGGVLHVNESKGAGVAVEHVVNVERHRDWRLLAAWQHDRPQVHQGLQKKD